MTIPGSLFARSDGSRRVPQLRIDEARRLEAVAMERAKAGDAAALGVLLMIYLGLRQERLLSESRATSMMKAVLWIPSGKPSMRGDGSKCPSICSHCSLRWLTPASRWSRLHPRTSCSITRIMNYVRRLCRTAGVPEVVPHSFARSPRHAGPRWRSNRRRSRQGTRPWFVCDHQAALCKPIEC